MKDKIVLNIIFSIIEKFFIVGSQFIVSLLLIRLLPREEYGIIGIVIGYFAFIHILNASLESIILRDHKKYDHHIEKYIYNFFIFNIFKSFLFITIASLLSYYLINHFNNHNFVYSIFSITFIYISDAIVAPLIIYNSAKFNQKLVTKISFLRSVLNVFVLLGLFYIPTLEYVFYKDLFVSLVYVTTWIVITLKIFNIKSVDFKRDLDLIFIKKSFLEYSIWLHLNGVVTNFIYKSDTFFLSMFVGLVTIGNYNIALTSANIANILPMILGYQNSVAISQVEDRKKEFYISNIFIRISSYLGILTFAFFYFFGNEFLYIMTNQKENAEIYTYMLNVVAGLVIVKSFASPLNAYINIKGSVKSLFKNVLLPTLFFTFIVYFISSKYYGAVAISQANILVSLLWLFLMIKEIKHYDYDFSTLLNFRDDLSFIKNMIKRGKKEL
ncbi:MAG: oligosaccharide flippase family protein [Campylobacterales bacterium]